MWVLRSNNPIPIEGKFNIRWEILVPSIRAGMFPAIIYPRDIKSDEVVREFVNGIMRREQQDNGRVLSRFMAAAVYYCNAKETVMYYRTGRFFLTEQDERIVAPVSASISNYNTVVVNSGNPSLWHHLATKGVNAIFLVEAALEPIYHNHVRISIDYKARNADL